jgi:hypothetical protein
MPNNPMLGDAPEAAAFSPGNRNIRRNRTGGGADPGKPKAMRLKEPPFALEDVEARRAWLWKLTFNSFQNRVAMQDKPDTRFAIHLSELLGLCPAQTDPTKTGGDRLGDFLENLSVEAFAEYKRAGEPL